ncbi:MAG TPA: pyrroline-5-carboxylate reductase [Firmicutes bacterium]|nr:pyrroline-5-carboxylate reductase [Bacillota bacterium]
MELGERGYPRGGRHHEGQGEGCSARPGKRLAVIGAGALGLSLIKGLIRAGCYEPQAIVASDPDEERRQAAAEVAGLTVTAKNREATQAAGIVVVAVKPQVLPGVLREIGPSFGPDKLLISVAAGVELAALEAFVPEGTPVVRAMPNVAIQVGEAATALAAGRWAKEEHLAAARELFGAVGRVITLPEALFHAVTALSGSGPAYVFLFLEAMADGGVSAGLPRSVAETLAAQTLFGAAKLALETGQAPALLRAMVMSPAGTTASGLRALELRGVRGAVIDAVLEAAKRSCELAASGTRASGPDSAGETPSGPGPTGKPGAR